MNGTLKDKVVVAIDQPLHCYVEIWDENNVCFRNVVKLDVLLGYKLMVGPGRPESRESDHRILPAHLKAFNIRLDRLERWIAT